MEQAKLDYLFSVAKSKQIIYEKVPDQKIIKIYSLDEKKLINGVSEFNINETSKLSKKINKQGFLLTSVEDYFNDK